MYLSLFLIQLCESRGVRFANFAVFWGFTVIILESEIIYHIPNCLFIFYCSIRNNEENKN